VDRERGQHEPEGEVIRDDDDVAGLDDDSRYEGE